MFEAMVRARRSRHAGLYAAPVRVRFKNVFGGTPAVPPPPAVTPPPTMPDPNSPDTIAARQKAMQAAQSAGRTSTTLTSSASQAAGTLAGGKLG